MPALEDLSEAERAGLLAIVNAKEARPERAQVAKRRKIRRKPRRHKPDRQVAWVSTVLFTVAHGEDVLGELIRQDLVCRWPQPTRQVVILTGLGAEVMGVEIQERLASQGGGTIEIPYWVPRGKGGQLLDTPRHPRECRLPFPEWVPAPEEVDPVVLAEEMAKVEEGRPPAIAGTLKGGIGDEPPVEPGRLFDQLVQIDPRLKPPRRVG